MASHFIESGNKFRIISSDIQKSHNQLPAGNYAIAFHPMAGFYLEPMDAFTLPQKLYGTHTRDADRILSTFYDRPSGTGVLLTGEKGSGKTMLAKLIGNKAAQERIPTLIVNQPYTDDSFCAFLASITQPCIIFFDEFEKIYSAEDQQKILTLMDGVFEGKKLFLITANDKYKVDIHMRNRPGRVYYFLEYRGLDTDFVREYCIDRLNNLSHLEGVCALTNIFDQLNFDMLQAIVEEMNRYDETAAEALRMLNCKPEYSRDQAYKVSLKVAGKPIDRKTIEAGGLWCGSPASNPFVIRYRLPEKVEDGDPKFGWVEFTPDMLVKMNATMGTMHFRDQEGNEALLSKHTPTRFDYRDSLQHAGHFDEEVVWDANAEEVLTPGLV